MKVYSVSGFDYDEIDGGHLYFRTKAEALASAREQSASGSEAHVHEDTIGRIDHETVVALLNRRGWSSASRKIATVRNGRAVTAASETV